MPAIQHDDGAQRRLGRGVETPPTRSARAARQWLQGSGAPERRQHDRRRGAAMLERPGELARGRKVLMAAAVRRSWRSPMPRRSHSRRWRRSAAIDRHGERQPHQGPRELVNPLLQGGIVETLVAEHDGRGRRRGGRQASTSPQGSGCSAARSSRHAAGSLGRGLALLAERRDASAKSGLARTAS